MIDFQNVSKSFGAQAVLADAGFRINNGEHVGIVGPNGAGKSTVFNLIVGDLAPDKGNVVLPAGCRLGYVRQQLSPDQGSLTLLDYAQNAIPELLTIQTEIHKLEDRFHRNAADNPAESLQRLGELQSRFEHMGGYEIRHRAEQALSGLGFAVDAFSRQLQTFSGGWQSRAELARVLAANPQVLLLDEPSNYLDIPAIEWLQRYLREFSGTLLLISHDRYLLNSLTSVTVEVANACVERYPGNYDYYIRERQLRYDHRLAAQRNQDKRKEQVERFIERFRSKNTKASQVQARVKMLAKMEDVSLPQRIVSPGKIRLRPPPHCGEEVVRLDQAGLTYDGALWVLRGLDLSVRRGEKLALVGLNGLGKTTLLRMLAGNLAPSEGRRVLGHRVMVGYQSQDSGEIMEPSRTVFDTVKSVAPDVSEQDARTLLGSFGFSGDAVTKPVAVLSGGEKIRVAFARLLIKPPNLLILDEPTTHLDVQARESLEDALKHYLGTLCVVSHDIDFVSHVATGIIAMTPPGITRFAGGYDHYKAKMEAMLNAAPDGKRQPAASGSRLKQGQPAALSADASSPTQLDKKALRRERALQRQAIHARTKDLKKAVQRAEQQVAVYEAERDRLVEQLSDSSAPTDFAGVSKRLKFIQDEIQQYTRKWEEAALELENIASQE